LYPAPRYRVYLGNPRSQIRGLPFALCIKEFFYLLERSRTLISFFLNCSLAFEYLCSSITPPNTSWLAPFNTIFIPVRKRVVPSRRAVRGNLLLESTSNGRTSS